MPYTADFETTTAADDCRVWAYGLCEIGNEANFTYGNSIAEFLSICADDTSNETLYFHNLKFDAEFIMCELFKQGYLHVVDRKDLTTKTFTTLISDKGVFYSMDICFSKRDNNVNRVSIIDSMKIINMSVAAVAKAFDLPVSKLEIDYDEYREIGHELTRHEVDYLRNDVTIMAMALNVLFKQDLKKMTTGSNAMADYKKIITPKLFEKRFPTPVYDYDIRQSYKGGYTYCDKRTEGQNMGEGIVLDVNSLYPSVMYYQPLPFGEGKYFLGKYEPDDLYTLYTQSLTCRFDLKPNHVPTIQVRKTSQFVPTEYLESSGIEDVLLHLTSVDLALFFNQYDVYCITYHDGWKFKATNILFKAYIEKWNGVKVKASKEGNEGMRTSAKLMLNSLYGKFSLNPNVQNKYPYYDHGAIKYTLGPKDHREPVYIPVGTFITAWARYKTITSAQLLYSRFLYADTDSLHLLGTEIPTELGIDDTELGKWKHEGTFRKARYIRQKTYIEDLVISEKKYRKMIKDRVIGAYEEDGKYYYLNTVCAGMPMKCHEQVTWENFNVGSSFTGKLQPSHVAGGIVLKSIDFSIKR